jgi:hypothetical protein
LGKKKKKKIKFLEAGFLARKEGVHDKGIAIPEEALAGTPKMSVSSTATPQLQSSGMLSSEQFLHLFDRFAFLASQPGAFSIFFFFFCFLVCFGSLLAVFYY